MLGRIRETNDIDNNQIITFNVEDIIWVIVTSCQQKVAKKCNVTSTSGSPRSNSVLGRFTAVIDWHARRSR